MPAHCARAIARRRHIAPVADGKLAAVGRDLLANHVVFEPIVAGVVKHLVVDTRRQVHRVALLHGKPLLIKEHVAATREYVVHLFEVSVLVVIRILAALERMAGKAL